MILSPSVLGEREAELLTSERELADRLEACLKRFESSAEDAETLRRVVLALRELFLLVIAGEFNAGKSAFINALVGQQILAEGVTPTTAAITLLRYGDTEATRHRPDGLEERTHPAEFLRDIAIVDTPGTNAVLRHHEQLTAEFIPRSDLVLFVTSADRPFTESERQFLERIRDWGKKVVLILNKVDLLRTEDELDEVLAFIRQHAAQLLGHAPEVFPLSARLAREARTAPDGEEGVRVWQTSRMGALRDYLMRTLDDEGRAKLKLLSPLGVMRRLAAKYLEEAQKRRTLLDEDARTVANLESQLTAHRQDLEASFEQRLQSVTGLLLEMRLRGDRFFDETVRLGRVIDLVQRERVRGAFVRDVVADTPARIGTAVDELIDWMVEQEQRRWQDINDYLTRRRRTASIVGAPGSEDEQVVGAIGATFDYSRRTVLRRVSHAAEHDLATYDRDAEAAQLSAGLQGAVAQTAVAGAGAIGLGVGLAVLVGTAAADFTGVVAGIVLASLGLGILPLHRRRARAQFDARIEELRGRLETTLRDQFRKEFDGGELRLQEALAPYTRFVRVERERVEEIFTALEQLQGDLETLRHQIES
ncbi:MAG TPA: dynamin family protein [Ktedonobacterales bacterium]